MKKNSRYPFQLFPLSIHSSLARLETTSELKKNSTTIADDFVTWRKLVDTLQYVFFFHIHFPVFKYFTYLYIYIYQSENLVSHLLSLMQYMMKFVEQLIVIRRWETLREHKHQQSYCPSTIVTPPGVLLSIESLNGCRVQSRLLSSL